MTSNPPPSSVSVVCEKHGLRYNPALQTGCVRCRRADGASPAPAGQPPKSGGTSLATAWVLALVLILAVGFALYATHLKSYRAGQRFREVSGFAPSTALPAPPANPSPH